MRAPDDPVAVEADEHFRVRRKALGRCLEDQVVDGVLLARFLQQLAAELHQRGHVDLGDLRDGRDLRVGLQHALRHDLAHAGELLGRVAVRQLRGSGGCSGRGSGDGSGSRCGGCLRGIGADVVRADAAAGAAGRDLCEVDAELHGDFARQRGRLDPSDGRLGRFSALHGGSAPSGGCGGRRGGPAGENLAGLADIGHQPLHGDVLTLRGDDLQQDAVHLADDVVCQLLGFDAGQHVADLDGIPLGLAPLRDRTGFHRDAELRHSDLSCHVCLLILSPERPPRRQFARGWGRSRPPARRRRGQRSSAPPRGGPARPAGRTDPP